MITKTITKVLKYVLIILMAVMVIDVTWQIITRFVLKNPSSYTEELAGFLLIWIGLLGSSYALYTKSHLGIDIITSKLSGTQRIVSSVLIYLIISIFSFFVLVIGGIRLVDLTFTLNQISPATEIPMGFVYLVLPITGVLMIYYSIVSMVTVLVSRTSKSQTKTTISIE